MKQDLYAPAGKPASLAKQGRFGILLRDLIRDKWLYLMLAPGVLYFIIFKYVPMYGVSMAFQDYRPHLGFWKARG